MTKKNIVLIITILLLLIVGGFVYIFINNSKKEFKTSSEQIENKREKESINSNSKSVVIYFSATGTTKKIANYISEITNNNIIEIIPLKEYTDNDLNYNNDNSRANKEQNDNSSRPEIKNEFDIADYDTIYLGYPIWWSDVPKIILTFIENNNLEGKKIIPFCTSHSSEISASLNTLKSYKDLNIVNGRRFSSSSTKSDVESWLKDMD